MLSILRKLFGLDVGGPVYVGAACEPVEQDQENSEERREDTP